MTITAKVNVAPKSGVKFGDIDLYSWFICKDDWEDYLFLKTDAELAVAFYLHGPESTGQEFYFEADDPVRPATKVNIEAGVE